MRDGDGAETVNIIGKLPRYSVTAVDSDIESNPVIGKVGIRWKNW